MDMDMVMDTAMALKNRTKQPEHLWIHDHSVLEMPAVLADFYAPLNWSIFSRGMAKTSQIFAISDTAFAGSTGS